MVRVWVPEMADGDCDCDDKSGLVLESRIAVARVVRSLRSRLLHCTAAVCQNGNTKSRLWKTGLLCRG